MPATVAAAIPHPPAHPMTATPRAFIMNLHLVCWRGFFQVLAVIGELGDARFFDVLQRVCQRHFAVTMMVPVRFAVRGDMNELIPLPTVIESPCQPVRQLFAARQ